MAVNYLTFSQSLTPKISIQNSDTLFCFTMGQTRSLAVELQTKTMLDSLNLVKDHSIGQYEKRIELLDSVLSINSKRESNYEEALEVKEQVFQDQITIHKARIKELKVMKRKFYASTVLLAILTFITVLK